MYLIDDVVYALFRSWGHYEEVDGMWQWVTSSHVEALNVADPAAISTIGSIEIPGYLSDSRMVGDVLYTVSFQDIYCWNCQVEAPTIVTSFAAGDPSSFAVLDELTIIEPEAWNWGWTRSITVTDERIYVGGVSNDSGSTIHVVDISDPGGNLGLGAAVPVEGHIRSRWQMDEHDGVLRVISQPWSASESPMVETFTVASSTQVTPLGSMAIQLPQPESLRAVRFDGTKAYAITAEQIDPLFTIDLTDPQNPVQRGELEIPGWIYHIEPRGDRLLTLGFDNASMEGSLHVSLFDVSNLDTPTMIRRIPFGGDWSDFAEDQDRIHKAFAILPELNLLAIPYSAATWDDNYCYSSESGIQLVDWTNDDLARRGVAPVRGGARRAFMHDDKLFGLSDEQLRTFDITNRDAPTKVAELGLSSHVSRVLVSGGYAVRLAADWWSDEPRLEVVSASDPASHNPIGVLDLAPLHDQTSGGYGCYWGFWDMRLFAQESTAYLVWSTSETTVNVATVDVSNPAAPTLLAHTTVPIEPWGFTDSGYYASGTVLITRGTPVAQVGSKLVFREIAWPLDEYGYPDYLAGMHGGTLRVLDLANPSSPVVSAEVPLPDGAGYTGLVADGTRVLFSHWVPVDGMPGKVRFYFDRLDLGGAAPALLQPINVPGSHVAFDAQSGNLLTVDYVRYDEHVDNYQACFDAYGWSAYFEPDDEYAYDGPGTCSTFDRLFKVAAIDEEGGSATLLDSENIDTDAWVSDIVVGDDRIFFSTYDWDYVTGESTSAVWAIGGYRAANLGVGSVYLEDVWYATPAAAQGKSLVALSWPGAAVEVDASNIDALEATKLSDVPWWVEHVTFDGNRVLASLGPYGVLVVDLD
jgi:hypothetical protein